MSFGKYAHAENYFEINSTEPQERKEIVIESIKMYRKCNEWMIFEW